MSQKTSYPIYMAPTEAFLATLAKQQDPEWEVTGLEFIQWGKHRFSARWNWGRKGQRFTTEMSLGGAEPTLQAIENRVLKALEPEGKL